MKTLFTSLLFFVSIASYCCDCKDFSLKYEEEISDLIFIGQCIYENNFIYEYKVNEIFKNNIDTIEKSTIIQVRKNSCVINADTGENWIIYGILKGKNFEVSQCGFSANLDQKIGDQKLKYKSPLNFSLEDEEIIRQLKEQEFIYGLRLRILEYRFREIRNSYVIPIHKENDLLFWAKAIIGILLLLNLILIFILVMKHIR